MKRTENIRMMLYSKVPLVKRSLFQKIFNQHPEENSVRELNNYLAERNISDISPSIITSIERKYKIKLAKEYKPNLEEFYVVYLNHCLRDGQLSNEEIDDLKHLKETFGLDNKSVVALNHKLGAEVYQRLFKVAISNGIISDENNRLLENFVRVLRMDVDCIAKIQKQEIDGYMNDIIRAILIKEKFSLQEQEDWERLKRYFQWENFDVKSEKKLLFAKQNWALENLELLRIVPDVQLAKNEICYLQDFQVKWCEYRTLKGEPYLKHIDTGNIFVTNKRVMFVGVEKVVSIKLEDILTMTRLKRGLEFKKAEGKSPVVETENDLAIMIAVKRILALR